MAGRSARDQDKGELEGYEIEVAHYIEHKIGVPIELCGVISKAFSPVCRPVASTRCSPLPCVT
jgi:hypothetical protein